LSISPSRAFAIELDALTFSYGDRRALDDLSLDVPAGSIFGLLGPNGSGKSTLISLLIGLRTPASGSLQLLGGPPSDARRARIGAVFQEPSLDPLMTVRETMLLQARLFGLPPAQAQAGTDKLLARVGLSDRSRAFTGTLSGGMKRRLELARALLPGPELLLLDEPTLALDLDSRRALWDELLAVNAARPPAGGGVTLLLATNDVDEAERYCGFVALLDEGRLIACDTPEALKRDLRHDAVRIDWHGDAAARAQMLRAWEGVGSVRLAGETTHVTVDAAMPFLTRVFQKCGDEIRAVRIDETTLEDVYFQRVGRGIAASGVAS
jgi:ABC-2 type transport system ATP-binding protein